MFIRLNDVNYHVQIAGEGEPLLLLHGFTGSLNSWNSFIDEWGKHFRLILVDIIGHGKTDHPEDFNRYSMQHVVDDLVDLLARLEITKTNILGYSMGGRLALSFAILHPDRVHSLILESSSPGLLLEKERLERAKRDRALADRIEMEGIEAFVDFWKKIPLFQTQERKLSEDKKLELRAERLSNSEIGLANSLRGMGTGVQPSWWNSLSKLYIPVLLLVGELDEKFYIINKKMEISLSNADLIVIQDAGHAIHVEQPEIFGKIIMDYLLDKLQNK